MFKVKDELEPLIASMLAYIGNFDHTSLMAKGEVTARVFSLFISSLSEKYPKILFKNVAHIVPYLSFDVYFFYLLIFKTTLNFSHLH